MLLQPLYTSVTLEPTSAGTQLGANATPSEFLCTGGHVVLFILIAQLSWPLPLSSSCGHDCRPSGRTPIIGEKRLSVAGTAHKPAGGGAAHDTVDG